MPLKFWRDAVGDWAISSLREDAYLYQGPLTFLIFPCHLA